MEQIKTQNLQGYEEYRNGEITRDQFASTKTQLEKEKLNLQKRIQEVENLIGDEKEILLKKNIPVDQMIEFRFRNKNWMIIFVLRILRKQKQENHVAQTL